MLDLIAMIPLVGPILSYLIPFVIVLSIVVFVHEYGHYIVGRWCGIKAETFSIGFGKPLFGWTDKRGTRWQVAVLPLGGFVRFTGDMDPASAGRADESELSEDDRRRAFHNAALWKRALTVLAGPVANFLLSIVVFGGIGLYQGQEVDIPVIDEVVEGTDEAIGFQSGDTVRSIDGVEVTKYTEIYNELARSNGREITAIVEREGREIEIDVLYRGESTIGAIQPGMPAAAAGILPGDVILSFNGQDVASFFDLRVLTSETPLNTPITVEVEREGEVRSFTFTPDATTRAHPITDEQVEQATLGVRAAPFPLRAVREPMGPLRSIEIGMTQTWRIATGTLSYIGDMIFADADTSQLGGPIRIAEFSKEGVESGLDTFFFRLALLSTSIGLLNLMPIPILDGGHLMFYLVEALRGRPVGPAVMQVGMFIGLSLVLLLMVFATYNDLTRLF